MFNWHSGSWHSPLTNTGERRRITIAADWDPRPTHLPYMLDSSTRVYGDLLPLFQKSDLNIVNVECTLSTLGDPIPKGGPNLRSDSRAIGSLLAVPFHVATMANNHTADFGPDALADTISKLQTAGLHTVGAGLSLEEASRPLLLNVKGMRLAIINCGEGEECRSVGGGPGVYGIDVAAVEAQVKQLRAEGHTVVTIFHGGREFAPVPPPYVIGWLRRIAMAGCAAVVAHHPHVPQGIEIYNGIPIVYSLGNFVFWQPKETFMNHSGYLLHMDFAGDALLSMEVTPYHILHTGVRAMEGTVRDAFMQQLALSSAVLKDDGNIRAVWNAVADEFGLEYLCREIIEDAQAVRNEGNVKNAARLKNRFFTEAARELYISAMYRVAHGDFGTSPLWAREMVQRWTAAVI